MWVCDTKTQISTILHFYSLLREKLHIIFLCKTVVKIGIWSCWRQVAGVLWLYRYAYFEALISKLQKQIEEVHFTVDRAPSDWLSLSRGGGACWIVMNFFQWIDTFSHLTWFSCSETQHCMKSSHTATKQTLTNAVCQETRVWVL